MDLGVRGSQIISEKLPIFNSEGYRVGSSRARGHDEALDAPNAERPHALHLQLTMTPGTPSLDPPFSRNFRRLVLGCIKTDFYNQILILQDFSRSTRFTFLCTAPNSNFQQKFIKLFDIFYWNICKFCKILIKIIIFRTDFDEILSEFHEI